jgi:hypothetical protein
MKAIYLLSVLGSLCPVIAIAQAQQPPNIPKGQQDSVILTVVRSMSFKTSKSSLTANPSSEAAMDVKIKQLPGEPDPDMVYLITTAETKLGEYNFVPTC